MLSELKIWEILNKDVLVKKVSKYIDLVAIRLLKCWLVLDERKYKEYSNVSLFPSNFSRNLFLRS